MYSTIQCVKSAMNAKAPIVGIPIEGEHPFCVNRTLLKESLRGMEIIEAAIQMPLEENGQQYLQIYAKANRVTGIRKFYALNPYVVRPKLREWAEAQRKARQKPAAPVGKHARHIAKLEREIRKVGDLKPPYSYIVNGERYDSKPSIESGRQWAAWKREARLRNKLWHLANKGFHGKPQTSRALYDEARKLGVNPKLYSEFTKSEREHLLMENVHDYLRNFHNYCRLTTKPKYEFKPYTLIQEWGEKHGKPMYGASWYADWLDRVRTVKALRSEIEGVKAMM